MPPGEVISALLNTLFFTGRLTSSGNYAGENNWLVKIQPAISASVFQSTVIELMGHSLRRFDRNAGANMFSNYSLLFTDSANVAYAWQNIKQIRNDQKLRGEDTTAFYVLHFPLTPLRKKQVQFGNFAITVSPNPSNGIMKVSFHAPKEGKVFIGVYDMLGYEMEQETNMVQSPGDGTIKLNLVNLLPGIYFVRASFNGQIVSQKVILKK